ncbi:hypothetical protein GUITHDRAFT_145316 [Guillardia theta CCMP2712]|uniref:Carrier domain-containing protein n=1 Tax=Guillardia theta (strain CCMP2712) TaxID=905079 RepID=L1ILT7_GUITC|nr:hypothetical protein GUITHDRAFT_145316 [Guillardia theta CCMP2712]EKX37087.1 hypothetical protein GUITHDRAFT_145316 [Guillardia theta CCMP2712]|eukprot:XP_005824067.1 hypothetical protein GUITHDRAFT_145316 [Guillardia theta CCMP2712]
MPVKVENLEEQIDMPSPQGSITQWKRDDEDVEHEPTGSYAETVSRRRLDGSEMSIFDVLQEVVTGEARVRALDQTGAVEVVPRMKGEDVKKALKSKGVTTLLELMPQAREHCGAFAISDPEHMKRSPLTHSRLVQFLRDEDLSKFGVSPQDRCAILLPNGPELAVCLLLAMSRCCCVPVNYQQTLSEIEQEVRGTRCKALISLESEGAQHEELCRCLGLVQLAIIPSDKTAGLFSLKLVQGRETEGGRKETCFTRMHDVALVLHTSGTSGKKKMVPYSLETIIVGAACIIESWGLSKQDCCINMMPLFHIGGILRNIVAPASRPTQHKSKLRMVANAAGGLLASLAERMRSELNCTVLPSYGMTECMPISSPSSSYQLDRPGSSGQIVGPLDAGVGEEGNITLKGAPVMNGYEEDEEANREAFLEGGWFNTGDRGYVDEDGWIYLTGRSKEIINRGGEVISPFEVEEAMVQHERIKDVIAFSAPHAVFQEVVAIALVPQPGMPRVDLEEVHRHASSLLHPAKWPQLLVFMDEIPKGQANKAQRIRLASRLGIAEVEDKAGEMLRLFEASAPPRGSGLNVMIPMRAVPCDDEKVERVLDSIKSEVGVEDFAIVHDEALRRDGYRSRFLFVSPSSVIIDVLQEKLKLRLHAYLLPKEILAVDTIPLDRTSLLAGCSACREGKAPKSISEEKIQSIWEELLGRQVAVDEDFFESGGSSLLAGRMASKIRKSLQVSLPASSVFMHRTIEALAALADRLALEQAKEELTAPSLSSSFTYGSQAGGSCKGIVMEQGGSASFKSLDQDRCPPFSSTSFSALLLQALPLFLLHPLQRIAVWLFFVFLWFEFQTLGVPRLYTLIIAILLTQIASSIVLPIVFILFKWTIIGRYKKGRYPLWGQYYLRWWLVDQMHSICGIGVFNATSSSLRWYYRMLGAKIGSNVIISNQAKMGEFDLISIGSDSCIDKTSLRAFCLDNGSMVLAPLLLGNSVSVPVRVSLVPGIPVPDGCCFPPSSSSYEISSNWVGSDNAKYCRARARGPSMGWYLAGLLIKFLIALACALPIFGILVAMVRHSWYHSHVHNYYQAIMWFLTPGRIGYYVAIRIVRATVIPFLRFFLVLLVKWTVIGRFTEEDDRDASEYSIFRHWLMRELLPGERLQTLGQLVGSHYSAMSWVLRLLGAKVGERVYWPGSGLEGLVEYDLLHVGDDVVFGSRSNFMACHAHCAKTIRIEDGANIGDRCVLLPGCVVGRNAVLGSGGIACEDMLLPAGSKWVGSRDGRPIKLEDGNEETASAPTLRPFGNAFYLNNAPYLLLPEWAHAAIGCLSAALTACFRSMIIVAAFKLAFAWMHAEYLAAGGGGGGGGQQTGNYQSGQGGGGNNVQQTGNHQGQYGGHHPHLYFITMAARLVPIYVGTQGIASITALLLAVSFKWIFLGRRKVGSYNWDASSYCQWWQVYLSSTSILRSAYNGRAIPSYLQGSAYLVWFFRLHGSNIGSRVCLYPLGADPMMTEPELVDIEDGAAVDNASLIGHLNSRGEFSLNRVHVGQGCTLRANTRLLSGSGMMRGSMLLEHTLILSGEVVEEDEVMQGWPAESVSRSYWTLRAKKESSQLTSVVVIRCDQDKPST